MQTSSTPRRRKALRSKLLRRGSILVLSAAMLVAIFAFTSFTVDVGLITVTKAQLETAADAGSLAASLELSQGLGPVPEKPAAEVEVLARQAAVDVDALHRSGNLPSAFVNANRDVRFGQVYWDTNTNSWVKAWGVAPYNMVGSDLAPFRGRRQQRRTASLILRPHHRPRYGRRFGQNDIRHHTRFGLSR